MHVSKHSYETYCSTCGNCLYVYPEENPAGRREIICRSSCGGVKPLKERR